MFTKISNLKNIRDSFIDLHIQQDKRPKNKFLLLIADMLLFD